MKKHAVLFFVLLTVCLLTACHQKAKRAMSYREDFLRAVQIVIDSSLDYGDALQSYEKPAAMQAQQRYAGLVERTIGKAQQMKDFDGDTTLQHYSLELLLFYKNTLDGQIKPFLESVKADTFSEDERRTADSLYGEMTMQESRYWDMFNRADKNFYKKFEISTVEK